MVPIATKTHVKQGGGSWKPYKPHTTKITFPNRPQLPPRFPTVSSLPQKNGAPGGDSWEQLPPFVPNNLGLSSPWNICKRHPNKFHYLPFRLEWNVCFRDVGRGWCCFDISSLGWLKRIGFFEINFYFWGMDYFWSLEEFVKDLHVMEGPPLNMLLHVWFRILKKSCIIDFVLGLLYLLCPRTYWKHVSSAHASECDQHGACSQLLCHGNCESSDRKILSAPEFEPQLVSVWHLPPPA